MSLNLALQIRFKDLIFVDVVVVVVVLNGTCPQENKPRVRCCFSVTFGILSALKFSNSQMQRSIKVSVCRAAEEKAGWLGGNTCVDF